MSVSSNINQNGPYEASGNVFPVTFYFFSPSDLIVQLTDAEGGVTTLVQDGDYSVSGTADPVQGYINGGTVTTDLTCGADCGITISRTVEATQPLVYNENDKFPAKSHERGLDRLTMSKLAGSLQKRSRGR
ncbi:MAG: hypothetical protein ABI615_04000 [Chthoniobacterales bacterium]